MFKIRNLYKKFSDEVDGSNIESSALETKLKTLV